MVVGGGVGSRRRNNRSTAGLAGSVLGVVDSNGDDTGGAMGGRGGTLYSTCTAGLTSGISLGECELNTELYVLCVSSPGGRYGSGPSTSPTLCALILGALGI